MQFFMNKTIPGVKQLYDSTHPALSPVAHGKAVLRVPADARRYPAEGGPQKSTKGTSFLESEASHKFWECVEQTTLYQQQVEQQQWILISLIFVVSTRCRM